MTQFLITTLFRSLHLDGLFLFLNNILKINSETTEFISSLLVLAVCNTEYSGNFRSDTDGD